MEAPHSGTLESGAGRPAVKAERYCSTDLWSSIFLVLAYTGYVATIYMLHTEGRKSFKYVVDPPRTFLVASVLVRVGHLMRTDACETSVQWAYCVTFHVQVQFDEGAFSAAVIVCKTIIPKNT